MELLVNKDARVSILGYHDFSEERSTNDMVLNIDDFRKQMEAIAESEIPVISMREFLDWKQGKASIPAQALMITIDDGWISTHTLAMDVLKQYGYPFTIFLYENFVGNGGRSLSFDQVRELAAAGATICSHSVSHDFLTRRHGRSDQAYEAWLRTELEDSHQFLVENFGDTGAVIKAFAYPYGAYNDKVEEMAREAGYEACFTVNGQKTSWETNDMEIGRYIVLGKTLANFDPALNFGGGTVNASGRALITGAKDEDGDVQEPLVSLYPAKDARIRDRLPRIRVDLSKLQGVEEESIFMRITGFGRVPHVWDPVERVVSFQVPQRLRLETCGVQVGFRHDGNPEPEMISWNFQVDHLASYLDPVEPVEGEEFVTTSESP